LFPRTGGVPHPVEAKFGRVLAHKQTIHPEIRIKRVMESSWNVLVTERCTLSLYTLLMETTQHQAVTLEDMYDILFQVVYTLECFRRLGLRHNDLHLGNVGILHTTARQQLRYAVPAQADGGAATYVQLHTRYVVKLFDMDRSTDADPRVLQDIQFSLDTRKVASSPAHSDLYYFLERMLSVLKKPECKWAHAAHTRNFLYAHFFRTQGGVHVWVNEFSMPVNCMYVWIEKKLFQDEVNLPTIRPFVLPLPHHLVDGPVSRN
jgi:hypothetical protein